jgi:hypothetical protein
MILLRILIILLIIGAVWVVWWAVNRIVRIRRENRLEALKTADERVEDVLEAGAVAGSVSDEDLRKVEEAKHKVRDRIHLGERADGL